MNELVTQNNGISPQTREIIFYSMSKICTYFCTDGKISRVQFDTVKNGINE